MTKLWQICVVAMLLAAAMPSSHAAATAPPTAPPVTNDLLPANDVTNCIGTVERAGCGSKARADGHTYLVFLALTAGLVFIGWRVARGVRARDKAQEPVP